MATALSSESTSERQPWVLAVITDLMFQVSIESAARRAGRAICFEKTAENAMCRAREIPSLILIDLNAAGVDTIALVGALKQDEHLSSIQVAAYVSHVETTLRAAAEQAGAAPVMARSVLAKRLPELLAAI